MYFDVQQHEDNIKTFLHHRCILQTHQEVLVSSLTKLECPHARVVLLLIKQYKTKIEASEKQKFPIDMTIGFFFIMLLCHSSVPLFVCIYFTSSPSFILFTLCVYSTLSIENFSYLFYNNKNQTWLVPERASVKTCKREHAYGERERALSRSLTEALAAMSSNCLRGFGQRVLLN